MLKPIYNDENVCINDTLSLNSSNLVLKFWIMASRGRIHREEGKKIKIKRYIFGIFRFKKQR